MPRRSTDSESHPQPTLVVSNSESATPVDPTAADAESRTDQVRTTAYLIWLAEGCPEGREIEHWLEAERRHGGADLTLDIAAE
jgi:hypothetical protein